VAQVVHHVADSHINAYVRFKLAVTEDNPPVKAYNEGAVGRAGRRERYRRKRSLDLLAALHGRWWHSSEAWTPRSSAARTIIRRWSVALDHALALYAWHGRHHTAHITSLRERMGGRRSVERHGRKPTSLIRQRTVLTDAPGRRGRLHRRRCHPRIGPGLPQRPTRDRRVGPCS